MANLSYTAVIITVTHCANMNINTHTRTKSIKKVFLLTSGSVSCESGAERRTAPLDREKCLNGLENGAYERKQTGLQPGSESQQRGAAAAARNGEGGARLTFHPRNGRTGNEAESSRKVGGVGGGGGESSRAQQRSAVSKNLTV